MVVGVEGCGFVVSWANASVAEANARAARRVKADINAGIHEDNGDRTGVERFRGSAPDM